MLFLFIDGAHVETLTRTVCLEIVKSVTLFFIRLTCASTLSQLRTCVIRRKVREASMTGRPHRVTFPVQIFLQRTGSRKVPVKENCHVYHQRIIKSRRHNTTDNSNPHRMYVCVYVVLPLQQIAQTSLMLRRSICYVETWPRNSGLLHWLRWYVCTCPNTV